MQDDSEFSIQSTPAVNAFKTAEKVLSWIEKHSLEASLFEKALMTKLSGCIQHANTGISGVDVSASATAWKKRREHTWTNYHTLRTSEDYKACWRVFLGNIYGQSTEVSVMFYQYVSDYVLKKLLKQHHPVPSTETQPIACCSQACSVGLTFEEKSGLCYAAGYVPRALKRKLLKSSHPLKNDLLLCLLDLLDDGDDEYIDDEATQWIDLIDRGGLTRVNGLTLEVFVCMENELRSHLSQPVVHSLGTAVKKGICDNEDVKFFWSMLSAGWDQQSASTLLEMIVDEWVKIRGFSYASAWIEQYKIAQKKTLQKSKGIRKQL